MAELCSVLSRHRRANTSSDQQSNTSSELNVGIQNAYVKLTKMDNQFTVLLNAYARFESIIRNLYIKVLNKLHKTLYQEILDDLASNHNSPSAISVSCVLTGLSCQDRDILSDSILEQFSRNEDFLIADSKYVSSSDNFCISELIINAAETFNKRMQQYDKTRRKSAKNSLLSTKRSWNSLFSDGFGLMEEICAMRPMKSFVVMIRHCELMSSSTFGNLFAVMSTLKKKLEFKIHIILVNSSIAPLQFLKENVSPFSPELFLHNTSTAHEVYDEFFASFYGSEHFSFLLSVVHVQKLRAEFLRSNNSLGSLVNKLLLLANGYFSGVDSLLGMYHEYDWLLDIGMIAKKKKNTPNMRYVVLFDLLSYVILNCPKKKDNDIRSDTKKNSTSSSSSSSSSNNNNNNNNNDNNNDNNNSSKDLTMENVSGQLDKDTLLRTIFRIFYMCRNNILQRSSRRDYSSDVIWLLLLASATCDRSATSDKLIGEFMASLETNIYTTSFDIIVKLIGTLKDIITNSLDNFVYSSGSMAEFLRSILADTDDLVYLAGALLQMEKEEAEDIAAMKLVGGNNEGNKALTLNLVKDLFALLEKLLAFLKSNSSSSLVAMNPSHHCYDQADQLTNSCFRTTMAAELLQPSLVGHSSRGATAKNDVSVLYAILREFSGTGSLHSAHDQFNAGYLEWPIEKTFREKESNNIAYSSGARQSNVDILSRCRLINSLNILEKAGLIRVNIADNTVAKKMYVWMSE